MKINMEETPETSHLEKLFVFDLDDTLTASKQDIGTEMKTLLSELLTKTKVAVIGGGNRTQFKQQFTDHLEYTPEQYENLFILPTSGGSMYRYIDESWQCIYENSLTDEEKKDIFAAFEKVLKGYKPEKTYGDILEDRGSQITFSALGQQAPLEEKEKWNKEQDVRPALRKGLEMLLPNHEVRIGGSTSIDVTKKGITKAYGIQQLESRLGIAVRDMIYIGDALYEGGNDYAVMETGIDTHSVRNAEDTKQFLKDVL